MRSKDTGIAIIGSGRIGGMRARMAAAHPGVGFLAVADIDPEPARALAEKVGAHLWTTDVEAAIARPEVGAVVVATGEHQHVEPALAALALGKSVLIEKPIALSLADADRIIAMQARTGASLHVGYSRRFKRRYLLAKEQVRLGRLGKLVGMVGRLYNSRAQVFQMLKRNPGATPVVDSLTYYVDLLNWFAPDNPVVEVLARGQKGVIRSQGYDTDDVTCAVLTLDDGGVVNLIVSFVLPDKYPSLGYCGRVELLGTEGVLMIDDDHLDQLLYTERGIPHIYVPGVTVNMAFLSSSAPGDWAMGDFWGPLASETRAWLDHLTTGNPCALTTASEARSNLEITLAIERAVESRERVTLPLDDC